MATGSGRDGAATDDARLRAAKKNLLHPLSLLAGDFRDRIRQGLRARGHRLHPGQSSVLVHLDISGSRPSELAARAGMTKQAMGKIVAELEEIGYVEKGGDPADGRARVIRFTDKGLALLADSAEIVDGIWGDYAELIGEGRLEHLRRELAELLQQLATRGGGATDQRAAPD